MRKGFTLIELLVVIAIIAILAAILFPVFGKAREKARQTHCTNNQKSFATAVQIYTQEHDETLPPANTFWGDIRVDKAALKCMTRPSLDNGYAYNGKYAGLGIGQIRTAANKMKDANTVWLTGDSDSGQVVNDATLLATTRHNGKAITSFMDGHVDMASKAQMGYWDVEPLTAGGSRGFAIDPLTAPDACKWTITQNGTPYTTVTIPDGATAAPIFPANGTYVVTATSIAIPGGVKTWTVTVTDPVTASMTLPAKVSRNDFWGNPQPGYAVQWDGSTSAVDITQDGALDWVLLANAANNSSFQYKSGSAGTLISGLDTLKTMRKWIYTAASGNATRAKADTFVVDPLTTYGYSLSGNTVPPQTCTFTVKASTTPRTVSIYYFSDWDTTAGTKVSFTGPTGTTPLNLTKADLGDCGLQSFWKKPMVLRVTFNCATGTTNQVLSVTFTGGGNDSQLVAVAVK